MMARRWAAVHTRVLRPMSMISPSGPSTIRLKEQSQAESAKLLDGEDVPVFGLVETSGDALEGR